MNANEVKTGKMTKRDLKETIRLNNTFIEKGKSIYKELRAEINKSINGLLNKEESENHIMPINNYYDVIECLNLDVLIQPSIKMAAKLIHLELIIINKDINGQFINKGDPILKIAFSEQGSFSYAESNTTIIRSEVPEVIIEAICNYYTAIENNDKKISFKINE